MAYAAVPTALVRAPRGRVDGRVGAAVGHTLAVCHRKASLSGYSLLRTRRQRGAGVCAVSVEEAGVLATLAVPVGGALWMAFAAVFEKLDANHKVVLDLLVGLEAKVDTNQQELLAAFSCLPDAFSSVATGLREAAAGPVRAFVAASPADITTWLTKLGFPQYAPNLAPLGGSGLLLQTPASLLRLGVVPDHVPLLLKEINAAAKRAPPDADTHDAR